MKNLFFLTVLCVSLSCGPSTKHEKNKEGVMDTIGPSPIESDMELTQAWNADTLFESWNAATRIALTESYRAATNEERSTYQMILKYFNENEGTTLNPNVQSTRRKFLTALKRDTIALPVNFFLIEADRSGEMYKMNTYLAYADGPVRLKIYHYKYDNIKEQWYLDSVLYKENKLTKPLNLYRVGTKEGRNGDDVCITKFQESRVLESSYYLINTLSAAVGLEEIIDRFRQNHKYE